MYMAVGFELQAQRRHSVAAVRWLGLTFVRTIKGCVRVSTSSVYSGSAIVFIVVVVAEVVVVEYMYNNYYMHDVQYIIQLYIYSYV